MRVVLIRHGPAARRDARRWPDDSVRPLTEKGAERTRMALRGLRKTLKVARVLSSPLLRAVQTADLVRRVFECGTEVETLAALSPGGSYHRVVERLAQFRASECVALVGHEPDLGKLAAVLIFGAPAANLPFKKAGACVVDFVGKPDSGHGRLYAFLPPRTLRLRARAGAGV